MIITYNNKEEFGNLYLHDFKITEFNYNDLDRYITMTLTSEYLKKTIHLNFLNVLYCKIDGMEGLKGEPAYIIDWYELSDEPKIILYSEKVRPIGVMFVKASITSIKIHCEKIDVEEKEIS